MQILLIRHFATDWNEAGRLQGHVDRPLSANGIAFGQDISLPEPWQGAPVLVSPLQRCQQTAALLGCDHALTDRRLIEMDMGEYEGAVIKTMRGQLGQAFLDNENRGMDYQPPNGESPNMVLDRVLPVLQSCMQNCVLICHKGVIRALLACAWDWNMIGKPPEKVDFKRPILIQLNAHHRPAACLGNLDWQQTHKAQGK